MIKNKAKNCAMCFEFLVFSKELCKEMKLFPVWHEIQYVDYNHSQIALDKDNASSETWFIKMFLP